MKSKTYNTSSDLITIEYLGIKDLTPYEFNSRKHSADQIEKIQISIQEFGFLNPIIANKLTKKVIAGHGRLMAAQKLKLDKVPVIFVDHLNEVQVSAFVIADNRSAELAEWDYSLLASELEKLDSLNYAFEITGFSNEDLDQMLSDLNGDIDPKNEPEEDFEREEIESLPENSPENEDRVVSKHGYIWKLGEHELICDSKNLKECDEIVRFWQELTDSDAILDQNGSTFDEVCNDWVE